MDELKSILGIYGSGALGTTAAIIATPALGSVLAVGLGLTVAAGGVITVFALNK